MYGRVAEGFDSGRAGLLEREDAFMSRRYYKEGGGEVLTERGFSVSKEGI